MPARYPAAVVAPQDVNDDGDHDGDGQARGRAARLGIRLTA